MVLFEHRKLSAHTQKTITLPALDVQLESGATPKVPFLSRSVLLASQEPTYLPLVRRPRQIVLAVHQAKRTPKQAAQAFPIAFHVLTILLQRHWDQQHANQWKLAVLSWVEVQLLLVSKCFSLHMYILFIVT